MYCATRLLPDIMPPLVAINTSTRLRGEELGFRYRARLPQECLMATISERLQAYRNALEEARNNDEQSVARKLEQQIQELEEFQQRHPEEAMAPSPLEVFCDLNPSDVNCRVYDD
jgi:hypothetical protein